MSQPNWIITTLIGAMVGALLSPSWALLRYPFRRLRRHPLAGRWLSYHYTFVNEKLTLRYGSFLIRPGIRQRYVVLRENSALPPGPDGAFPLPVLRYRGTVDTEGDNHVMIFSGRSHREKLVYRFVSRLPSNSAVIPGLWMAYDHDLNPAAGAAILSRSPLTTTEVTNHINSWVVQKKGAFHIRAAPVWIVP